MSFTAAGTSCPACNGTPKAASSGSTHYDLLEVWDLEVHEVHLLLRLQSRGEGGVGRGVEREESRCGETMLKGGEENEGEAKLSCAKLL